MKFNDITKRAFIIGGIVALLAILCAIKLFDLQIVNGEEYRIKADNRSVRTYVTKAPRGEIYDRYGVPIVENRPGYSIQMNKTDVDNDVLNDLINEMVHLLKDNDDEYTTTFPIEYNEGDKIPEYNFGMKTKLSESDKKSKYQDSQSYEEQLKKEENEFNEKVAKWESDNKLLDYKTLREIVGHYKEKYAVSGKYSDSESLDIISVRYEMETRKFNKTNPFILATDVGDIVLQKIKETYAPLGVADIISDTIRTYSNGTMAAHILGRTGIIYAEEYEKLREQGYGMNDIIGKEGLESVLEPYLKGTDGYKKIRMTTDGRYGDLASQKDAEPGYYAKLTLDSDLQKATEESLKKAIIQAVDSSGSGAAIALDPHNGQVLAIASYPTYDPGKFNEEYENLVEAKSKPLFNRALNGIYAPGSTFKILTAIAGLETHIIEPDTYIVDRGKYKYYSDYQPTCLVYSSRGVTHGTIDVSEAIGVSCNYFFYDIGRQTGIDAINEYSYKFGLGLKTGIELSEAQGVVSGPDERKAAGGEWQPGDVLQTAIGQSDNLFSPAQLASYISTVLNKGTRYKLQLVNEIVEYDTDNVVKKFDSEVLSENKISDSTFEAVKDGMRQVVADGTAASIFNKSKIKVGGKTGTAEVSDGRDNVLFTGFAPYDDPQIVVAVVIEHGATSSFAAQVARDMFEEYLDR